MRGAIYIKKDEISIKSCIWNEFISVVVNNDIFDLSATLQIPAMIFWYYNAVSNGGHASFFDDYSEIDNQKLIDALNVIGACNYAENFIDALDFGKKDDYCKADNYFGTSLPSLEDKLMNYVIANKDSLGLIVK